MLACDLPNLLSVKIYSGIYVAMVTKASLVPEWQCISFKKENLCFSSPFTVIKWNFVKNGFNLHDLVELVAMRSLKSQKYSCCQDTCLCFTGLLN